MGSLSGIIAKLSGSFTTTLLLAYLLPVLLFAFLVVPLFAPLVRHSWIQYLELYPLGFDQLTLIKIAVLGAATLLLYNFNVPIIQLYEGYYWTDSWVGRLSRRRHQGRSLRLSQTIADITRLCAIENVSPDALRPLLRELNDLSLRRESEYPPDANNVLPTRLGNCIRCFEQKPLLKYGFDAVTFWPHLWSLASERSLEAVAEAKRSFDFTLNLAFLAGVSALAAIAAGVAGNPAAIPPPPICRWLLVLILMFMLSFVFYHLAVGRAVAWGAHVNATIDLYRKELVAQLGYPPRSIDVLGEKRFWEIAGRRILFPANPALTSLSSSGSGPVVISAPGPLKIDVIRSINKNTTPFEIEWSLRNRDTQEASMVQVFDDVPQGFAIVSWSVRVSDPRGMLIKTDPLTFGVRNLKPGQTITFAFRIGSIEKPETFVDS